MKAELIDKFKTLLQTEDIISIREDVRGVLSEYNSETSREKKEQQDAWNEAEHEEGEEFAFEPNPLDEEFETILAEYRARMKEHREKIEAERKANHEQKRSLLKELETLIEEEENIGKAFSEFNRIQEEWSQVGQVPTEMHRPLMDDFIRVKDHFFYTINIYKQLQEHDLKRNEEKKIVLIERMKEAQKIESIREADEKVRLLQSEWMNIGPVTKENYKALADEFFGIGREIIQRIRDHYDGLRAEQDVNLEKKNALIEKVKHINELEIVNHSTWTKKTAEIIAIQGEWKTVGFVKKEENERIWTEFRTACDKFFASKQSFYDSRRESQNVNKDKKEALVKRAEEFVESQEWKKTTDALIALQAEWKAVGPATQKDEQRLWQQFRNACDKFFNAKKEYFSNLDSVQDENLRQKNSLIEEINAFELTGDNGSDVAALREFSKRWREIGFVPKKSLDEVSAAYGKALDDKYNGLSLERKERMMHSYKERVERLKSDGDGDRQVSRERRLLKDKLTRLNDRVRQFENNIELFSGSGAAEMRKEYDKKIAAARREMDEIREKLRML